MKVRTRIILVILILANALLAGYIVLMRWTAYRAASQYAAEVITPSSETPTDQLKVLPQVELYTDQDQKISTRQFIGTPLLVQFIDPKIRQQTDVVSAVLKERPKQPVTLLLITSSALELRQQVRGLPDNTIVVENDFKELRKLFTVPECCETSMIFDKHGSLVDNRYYYQGGLIAKLRTVVDGEPAFKPSLFEKPISSVQKGQLKTLRERSVASPSATTIVVLFSTVCTTCSSADLVDVINQQAANQQNMDFLILMPRSFTETDINNFKINLALKVPVALADEEVSRVWDSFASRYGQAQVNGIVIVMKQGRVSVLRGADQLSDFLANGRVTDANS